MLFVLKTHHQIQQQIQISLYTVLMAVVRFGFYYYFLHFKHPSPDSTANSDKPIHRLNGSCQIWILLLFFTLFNTDRQFQQQIQISIYTLLMASVRFGFYYYFLHFYHPSPDSTANSDKPIHRLIGHRQIGILLLFFTLFNIHHQYQQQIQIGLYTVLLGIVILGYYYYCLHLLTTITRFNSKFRLAYKPSCWDIIISYT